MIHKLSTNSSVIFTIYLPYMTRDKVLFSKQRMFTKLVRFDLTLLLFYYKYETEFSYIKDSNYSLVTQKNGKYEYVRLDHIT